MPQDTLASLTTLRLGGPAGTVLTISDPAHWHDAPARSATARRTTPSSWGTAET
ncbi:hypothetical protein ACFV4G_12055 [Kitasatospora sp. NPDC059747]|uniref:hypothetical protein n=1 Tax=Kitasatospora sp. NPDC059747 TaxID=3346930 RepID=UPI00364DFBDA